MMLLKWEDHGSEDEVDHNMSDRFKSHEIFNQSIHTSWSPQPGVKINEVMKEKAITSM